MRRLKSFLLVLCLIITSSFSVSKVQAAINNKDFETESIDNQMDDSYLTRKSSVIQFMKTHPEYKQEVMEILKNNGALNKDGSIKEDLGVSKKQKKSTVTTFTQMPAPSALYTGYYYYGGSVVDLDCFPTETIAKYTNTSNYERNFQCSQTYTVSTTFYQEATIGSKSKLTEVYEANAGVKISYSITQSASTQYGTTISVPARTTAIIEASPIKQCYGYMQQYFILGQPIGDAEVVGVYKPTGIHFYYSEQRN